MGLGELFAVLIDARITLVNTLKFKLAYVICYEYT